MRITADPLTAITLAHEPHFAIGPLQVRPETCEISDGQRSRVLEPRVMQALGALHQAAGHVVSRDDLLQRCWQGRIVGDDAITGSSAASAATSSSAAVMRGSIRLRGSAIGWFRQARPNRRSSPFTTVQTRRADQSTGAPC